jgi:hypothetical protein
MDYFNRGLSLLVVCQRSLVEVEDAVHEEQVMRDAIAIFRDVYEEIDAAERLIYSAGGGAAGVRRNHSRARLVLHFDGNGYLAGAMRC